MSTKIMDDVMKLPKKEKVKLYYALQEELDLSDDYLAESDLTKEQWKELNKRIKAIDSGKAVLIPWQDFKNQLDEKIKNLHSRPRRKTV